MYMCIFALNLGDDTHRLLDTGNIIILQGPGYTLSRFLKERQRWHDIQENLPSSFKSGGNGDQKRFRKTPPLQSPSEEGRYHLAL